MQLYKKLQTPVQPRIKQQRIYQRFKRLSLSFIVVTALSYFVHQGINDITDTFFAGVQADDFVIPEHQERLLAIQQDDAEITLLGSQPGKQTKVTLKACTGKKGVVSKGEDGKPQDKCFNGTYYESYTKTKNVNGFVEEWYSGELCRNFFVVPGTSLMSKSTQGVAYFIFLLYLFLGISINADIFMESIEVITSSTKDIQVRDKEDKLVTYQVPNWNPTIANLTLMALGSSAPEILLSVIESLKDLGEPAGVLGPASIVGSGAFNLLVITGISILSVDDPKKIYDLRVYAVTAIFSLFSYSWMFFCLEIWSPEIVTLTEAWLTLFFFFLLVGTAFAADKWTQKIEEKKKTENQKVEQKQKEELNIKKSQLRTFAKNYGEQTVISIARGNGESQVMTQTEQDTIIDTYKEILETNDLSQVTAVQMVEILQPDSLLERFKAKKANKMSRNQEFIEIRGTKGQVEEKPNAVSKNLNDQIGFKCLHYSVVESSGRVELTIVKKIKEIPVTFGVRTVKTTATPGSDYTEIDETHTLNSGEEQIIVKVPILDDKEWQPDLEFSVEIYDTSSSKRMLGDDTIAKVTILDEDFPGTLGFDVTMLTVSRDQEYINILIKREKGSDGKISCNVKTEPLDTNEDVEQNAKENIDYSPLDTYVEFKNGEMEKTIQVQLMNPLNNYNSRDLGGDQEKESDNENPEKMFKVALSEPKPDSMQISKKNVCIITILQNSESDKTLMREKALLDYFFEQQEATWKQQFKNAVMLGPSLDEDDMVINQPTLFNAIFHFLLITWKLVFAFIPPVKSYGGWPAFFIALAMVGGITFIVGDVAEILGCSLSIPPAVSAITLVAIGTSLPDTFASITAAQGSEFADSAVGNVTGSNSVNIFLGLGLPWVICAQYGASINKPYEVPAGKLSFTVAIFLICSVFCFGVLTARRVIIGGELGGPMFSKVLTASICFLLWVIYITLSILQSYGLIAS